MRGATCLEKNYAFGRLPRVASAGPRGIGAALRILVSISHHEQNPYVIKFNSLETKAVVSTKNNLIINIIL